MFNFAKILKGNEMGLSGEIQLLE